MTYQVGEHYRNTTRGRVLYKDVRLYTCPEGCQGTFYDFRRARPLDRPEKVLGFIKVPGRTVDVVGPLFWIGIVVAGVVMIAGFLSAKMPVPAKAAAITAVVAFGVWVAEFMKGTGEQGDE